jgi:soluble P-type ATPase
LVEICVIFLGRLVNEVEISKDYLRARDQREESEHLVSELRGKAMVGGGVDIGDGEREVGGGGG